MTEFGASSSVRECATILSGSNAYVVGITKPYVKQRLANLTNHP
jgi:hypothetical protein